MAPITQAALFGATIFVTLSLLRLVTPQPYERIGLSRLTFFSLDIYGYARYALIPAFLFGAALWVNAAEIPYWLTFAFGLAFATANVALFQLARVTYRFAENGGTTGAFVTLTFVGLNAVLLLGCIAIPFVARLLGYAA